ncbi:MAG: flippase [Patescibacteria group bacterium]
MTIRKAFSSTLFMLFSRIFFRVMSALIGILLARYLGLEQFGQYATVIAFVNLFMVFNDLGVSRLSLLEGSRDKEKLGTLLGNGLIIELVLSLVLFGLMTIIVKLIGYSGVIVELFIILAIAELLFESRKIYQSTLQALTKFSLISWQQIIYSILFFLLVLAAIFYKPEVKLVAYIQLFVSALLFLFYLIFVFKYVRPIVRLREIPSLLKRSWIFCISSVFFIVYFQIDAVMLSIMKSEVEVGLYSAAYRLVVAFYMIPQIIFQVALPQIYKFSLNNKEKLIRITHTIQKFLLAIAVPITVILWLGAEQIIKIVYGAEYLPATIVMQIMGVIIIIRFFTYGSSESITAINKQKVRAGIEGITAGLNIVLNLFLIPLYSYTGSAIATLISELVLGILFYVYIERYFQHGILKSLKYLLPTLICGSLMAIIFFELSDKVNVVFNSIISTSAYLLALYFIRFLEPYDIKLIKEILPFLDKSSNKQTTSNE